MKKIIEIFKKNVKLVIGIIIGGVVFGTIGVYAASYLYNSNEVSYNNTSSGISATNVQGAIDELYTKASKWLNPNDMGTPKYYAFGLYKGWCSTADTNCNSYANFPTTSTTPPSGKNVYTAKYADGQYGVCIKRNGKEHCFRGRNYKAEAKHLQEVFSDISCKLNAIVSCSASDFDCDIYSSGSVDCNDRGASKYCFVYADGSLNCY